MQSRSVRGDGILHACSSSRRLKGVPGMTAKVSGVTEGDTQDLYLDLLKRVLTRSGFPERYRPWEPWTPWKYWLVRAINSSLGIGNLAVVRRSTVDPALRAIGGDWPADAETMVGMARLNNLQECILHVIEEEVPGDLLEAGVWRGGACIFMRAMLAELGVEDRTVWVADSFKGLPPPSGRYPL